MRAFLQERQAIASNNSDTKLGQAILFYGCRDSDIDYICKDELKDWEDEGLVTVYPAFSRTSKIGSHKYVQDAS